MTHQYFSKWRKIWIDFAPNEGQLIELRKYNYQIKII
jgi:hypothetical protein